MERVFLNWDMPVLETTADYLVGRYFVDEQVDMRKALIVVTGSQAKRRLEELLQQKAAELDPAWFPPERITTIGTFPELLYPQKNPAANDLVQQLAWSTAIDTLSRTQPETIARLTERLPARSDWSSRLALGRLVAQLHLELAADRVDFGDVAAFCHMKHLREEAERWETLADLQILYKDKLDAVQLWDIQMARAYALEHDECGTDCDIVLVGLSDLNRMQRAILDAVGTRVTSLVFAPETQAGLFDEHGCVDAERWHARPLDIPDDKLEPADTPASQATAVLHWLQRLDARYAASDIVIGVPDESVVPFLSQQLGQVGIPHRRPAGTPVAQTPVYLLLESLSSFLQSRRYYDLLTLLRHPDVERFVNRQLQNLPAANGTQSWLVEFDTYYRDHLPLAIDGNWLPRPRRESDDDSDLDVIRRADNAPPRKDLFDGLDDSGVAPSNTPSTSATDREYHLVKAVHAVIETLIATLFESDPTQAPNADADIDVAAMLSNLPAYNPDLKRRPAAWCDAVKRLLTRLYQPRKSRSAQVSPVDHIIEKSFEQLNRLYGKLGDIPQEMAPTMTASDMISLLLRMWASERIAPLADGDEIELLGWLELLTDDAPALAITGLNEGIVPASKSADMFLPDGMRRELGLEDNMRRYARDAYALSAIMASRENVRLIFGKRSVEGDPLVPSRLVFATDENRIAERVRRFFAEPSSDAARPVFAGSLRAGQSRSDFDPKEPPKTGFDLKSLRVTEFRDYLQCPFRYYLKHRMRLDITDDAAEELDGGAFGDVAHTVLKLFGRSKIKDSKDAAKIADYLGRQLDAVVADVYGAKFRPVIEVQVEQLRRRLKAFAVAQAQRAASGFEILHVEYSPPTPQGETMIVVDDRPVNIRGRIDRVDFDHNSGKYVLLDYKTTAAGDAPDKTHRKKGEWVDLQLPLYEWLFSENNDIETGIEVGYVSLPKDTAKTGFLMADWHFNDFEAAREKARDVIRGIRNEAFWPPVRPAPAFSEIYSAICNDKQIRFFDNDDDDNDDE